jgi:hypothetical protein
MNYVRFPDNETPHTHALQVALLTVRMLTTCLTCILYDRKTRNSITMFAH